MGLALESGVSLDLLWHSLWLQLFLSLCLSVSPTCTGQKENFCGGWESCGFGVPEDAGTAK